MVKLLSKSVWLPEILYQEEMFVYYRFEVYFITLYTIVILFV